MKIQLSTKTFAYSLLAAMVLAIVVGSYGQNALGQTTQERNAAATANLTRADFNAVTANLITARQAIMNNDSVSAYNAINTAGSDLFQLRQNAGGGDETLVKELTKQLRPVQNNIDNTHDALQDINSTQALRSLNNADLRLLIVTQGLPPGEEDAEAETEE